MAADRWPRTARAIAIAVAAIIVSSTPGRAQERKDYDSGASLYQAFCAACHGTDGRGKGPVADTLRQPVPDLTLLARKAGGVFPRDRVRGALDGTRPMPSHATSAMPQWRAVLEAMEGDDSRARKDLEKLVEHLESLQVKGGS